MLIFIHNNNLTIGSSFITAHLMHHYVVVVLYVYALCLSYHSLLSSLLSLGSNYIIVDLTVAKQEICSNARWALFEAEGNGVEGDIQLLVVFSDAEVRQVGMQNLIHKVQLFQKV